MNKALFSIVMLITLCVPQFGFSMLTSPEKIEAACIMGLKQIGALDQEQSTYQAKNVRLNLNSILNNHVGMLLSSDQHSCMDQTKALLQTGARFESIFQSIQQLKQVCIKGHATCAIIHFYPKPGRQNIALSQSMLQEFDNLIVTIAFADFFSHIIENQHKNTVSNGFFLGTITSFAHTLEQLNPNGEIPNQAIAIHSATGTVYFQPRTLLDQFIAAITIR
jgi:hypothetical protein